MMALRRLLALAAAATVVADVVQVAILCDYLEARTAGRQDCEFDEWIPWGYCSKTSAGLTRPTRGVAATMQLAA